MIIFDATYLVVYLNPNPLPAKDRNDKPVERFKERVQYLAASFDASNEPIGIPAPAMAEVLVRAGTGKTKYVSILSDRWRFQILPFDSRAAIESAELIAQIKSGKQPWATWAKVKFDIQIVAIAKAENATVIYTDDKDIESYAKRVKIPVMRICDLPLPPADEPKPIDAGPVGSQMSLLVEPEPKPRAIELEPDGAEEKKAIAEGLRTENPRTGQTSDQLPANHAPVPQPGNAAGSSAKSETTEEKISESAKETESDRKYEEPKHGV